MLLSLFAIYKGYKFKDVETYNLRYVKQDRAIIFILSLYLNFIFLYKIFKITPHVNPETIDPIVLLNFKTSKTIKDTPIQTKSATTTKINLFFISFKSPLI